MAGMSMSASAQKSAAFQYNETSRDKYAPGYTVGQYVSVQQNGYALVVNGYRKRYLGNNTWGTNSEKFIKISDNEYQVVRRKTTNELVSGSRADYYRKKTYTSKGYLLRSPVSRY